MSALLPEATRKQPIIVWRCEKCGMVSETEWLSGTHADRNSAGLNRRCTGHAAGPFYLVSSDEYLDWLLAQEGARS